MNILYNKCYGGFSLPDEAIAFFMKHGYNEEQALCLCYGDCPRHLPILIEAFKKFGSGRCAKLALIEAETDIYSITEHDGFEQVVFHYGNLSCIHDLSFKKIDWDY